MELRPGNAGANTVADHVRVLTDALAQIPHSSQAKILVRVDGAGATHGLLERLEALNTARRTVRYTVGWKITDEDEEAIAKLPESSWETSLKQDGTLQDGYFIAELTDLNTREGWPQGMRLVVRRVKPSRRQFKKLTAFERQTGWRYSITATSIRHMWGIAGSHQPQFLDMLHRSHAGVEDRVRTNKAMGPPNLPSSSWEVNRGWMPGANLAADLDAWGPAAGPARHRRPGRRGARHHALSPLPPSRPPHEARPQPLAAHRCHLALGHRIHHVLEQARHAPRRHLTPAMRPDEDQEGTGPAHLREQWNPGAAAATREGPARDHTGQIGRTIKPVKRSRPLKNRG
ncbi:transposase [Streptomyces sp. NPDC001982]|uniref:transposase n=1 Tax=Streptomyces sp. NPDC001982 TaxID=3154405 RepID=UPI003325069A